MELVKSKSRSLLAGITIASLLVGSVAVAADKVVVIPLISSNLADGKFVNGDDPADAVYTGGNVGIGTTAPQAVLHVDGTPGVDGIMFPDGTLQTSATVQGPKGDTGDTGATGAQGVKGDSGDTGATGATGAQGLKGDKGDTGDTGETGAPGGSQIIEVTSAGQVWMDRNLGALRVGTKRADPDAYGSLYQWGRAGDGHEYRTSSTTATLSDSPSHGSFITANVSPYDWRITQDTTLWANESSLNNPCPAGFRLPTHEEWETERGSWSGNNSAGAFVSPLKLVVAGYRGHNDGTIYNAGSTGLYWSSTVDGSYSRTLNFYSGNAYMGNGNRVYGFSVRCLKD